MNKILSLLVILLLTIPAFSQELICGVTVNSQQVRNVDQKVFRTLETAIIEFMNNRKWTNDQYAPEEKIECEILLTITEDISQDRFKAQAQIQSSRPVFNSDYNTVMFNHNDKDLEFTYSEFEPLSYNENTSNPNLVAFLAYYANIVIGMDYDSFSPKGGTPHFLKAQTIVNNMQNSSEKGWKPFDGLRNRYWLVDNLLNSKFSDLRMVYYKYHMQALDELYENQVNPVKVVNECLSSLNKVHSSNPNSMAMQMFFQAKSDELINIFKAAPPIEKTKAIQVLNRVDAGNTNRYREILTTRK